MGQLLLFLLRGNYYYYHYYYIFYSYQKKVFPYIYRNFYLQKQPVWLNGWVFVYELGGCGFEFRCSHSRPNKSNLVSGNRPGENAFHSSIRIFECVSEYIFLISKQKEPKKAKETKEEKIISLKNLTGYDDIVCEYPLCIRNLIKPWISSGCLYEFMYNERNYSILSSSSYTTTTYEAHTWRTKIKKNHKGHFCLSFSRLYLFIRGFKFVIIEIRAYDIAHDENAMSSLIIQSI